MVLCKRKVYLVKLFLMLAFSVQAFVPLGLFLIYLPYWNSIGLNCKENLITLKVTPNAFSKKINRLFIDVSHFIWSVRKSERKVTQNKNVVLVAVEREFGTLKKIFSSQKRPLMLSRKRKGIPSEPIFWCWSFRFKCSYLLGFFLSIHFIKK